MTEREKLIDLVKEAKAEVNQNRKYYTDGWICEIERVIKTAEAAIDGKSVPFIRSRRFFEPREDDDILHATSFYSRCPSYDMQFYGLKPALGCLKKNRADKRVEELEKACERYRKMVSGMSTNGEIGSYDLSAVNDVKDALKKLDSTIGDERVFALVDVCNAMRRCIGTWVLRSDAEPDANLFLTAKEKASLLKNLKSNSTIRAYYEKVREYSATYTLEDTEKIKKFMEWETDYNSMNKDFYIWSKTDKTIMFHTPKNSAYAEFNLILPKEENEQEGLGHIWVDNIVVSSGLKDWDIKNNGFENGGENWTSVQISGKSELKVEDKYPYCGKEKKSFYICNPTPADEGGISYGEFLEIEADKDCTAVFDAKVDGKFKKGLRVEIRFFDKNKKEISVFTHYFNRKSVPAGIPFGLTMQTDAIMYYITGEKEYALKAKNQFMYVLNDFIQGQETWFAYDTRPDGSDAYGAVQGGRVLASLASTYTFIKDEKLFTPEEWEKIKEQLVYMVSYLYDGRPRAELDSEQVRKEASNWQTDMACGVGFLIMAMPKTPESRIWLDSINYFLKSQLLGNISGDGSWPESMRYHIAATERFAIYARVLKHCTGEDWFKETPLTDMIYFPVAMQTPPYEFMDGKISTPTIGDHIMQAGKEFEMLGLYYSDVYEADKEKGTEVYMTWKNAGKPMGQFGHEKVAMTVFLCGAKEIPEREIKLTSTGDYPEAGIYIMRGDDGAYCAISAPNKYIGHGHYDAGSIIIYKYNVPVVIDPGIESYFDATKDWYVSSSAHSLVQFERSGGKKLNPNPFDIHLEKTEFSAIHGWNDTAKTVKPLDFYSDEYTDHFSVKIDDAEGRGYIIRTVTFLKKTGAWLVEDKAVKYTGNLRWSLVTAMKTIEVNENSVKGKGYFDVDMDVIFLDNVDNITIETGRTTLQFPSEGVPEAKIIRATSKNGFKVLIYPHK